MIEYPELLFISSEWRSELAEAIEVLQDFIINPTEIRMDYVDLFFRISMTAPNKYLRMIAQKCAHTIWNYNPIFKEHLKEYVKDLKAMRHSKAVILYRNDEDNYFNFDYRTKPKIRGDKLVYE